MKKMLLGIISILSPLHLHAQSMQLPRSIEKSYSEIEVQNLDIERVGGTPYDGGRVWVNFQLLTPKRLASNSMFSLSPLLVSADGQEYVMPRIALLTARTQTKYEREGGAFDPTTLIARPGETVGYSVGIPFEAWMNGASLMLNTGAETRSNAYSLPTATLAYDLQLAQEVIEPLLVFAVPVTVEKIQQQQGSAFLEFESASSRIEPHYASNPVELAKIIASINTAMNNSSGGEINRIELWGTCSPEGDYGFNAKLARQRTNALMDYLSAIYGYGADVFDISSTPENWEGLRAEVENSSLENRAQILTIIDNPMLSPTERDAQMKRLHNYSELLRHYYPLLRRVDYTIHYELPSYGTLEELIAVYELSPQELSEAELFELWQSHNSRSAAYCELIESWATELYPQSPAACINMATHALENNDYETTEKWLRRAATLLEIQGLAAPQEHTATYYNTAAALQLSHGDTKGARLLFAKAANLGLLAAQKNHEAMQE